MPVNLTSSSRWFKVCGPITASLLLFAPGCGRDHNKSCSSCTTVVSDAPTYRSYENQPVVSYQPPPQTTVTQLPPMEGLRGPRSQAELDAIFNSAQVRPLPPPCPRPPAQLPSLPQDNVTIVAPGESGWVVPVSREWRHIVIHHSASTSGSAASFDRAHREKGWDGLGYHFVIGNGSGTGDGQVEVGYRWQKQMQGAHAGNYEYNQHGIGICLVGDFEHGGPPSPAQMQSLRKLVAFLQAKASIPTNEIIGHGNVPGRNTECPGRNLDVVAFRNSVGGVYLQRSAQAMLMEKPGKEMIYKASAAANTNVAAKPPLVKTVVTP
ncbi:MAG: peptidoglycan recognition family protein [Planctomycetota bacterium]